MCFMGPNPTVLFLYFHYFSTLQAEDYEAEARISYADVKV